ncbi:MAG: metalloregulator ArsR/SmtB family transcription factor [Actinomycetia bacterium]|nr:metalloregulator ArsR/SmtB family transcription factor [Actinomycetes bacterium]
MDTASDVLFADFWRGLAHPIRIRILQLLRERGSLTVSELVATLGLGQGHVSNHLSCLRNCGFVRAEPDGRFVRYALADGRIATLLEVGADVWRDHVLGVAACAVVREEASAGAEAVAVPRPEVAG